MNRKNQDICPTRQEVWHIQAISVPRHHAMQIQIHHPDPVNIPVQYIIPYSSHSLPPFPSTHILNSFAHLAISNASGGRPFAKMPNSLLSSMPSPSLPFSSSLSTHSDSVSTSFCTDCSLGEASCVFAIIWEVVDTMAARWSRMSGPSADVRMEETRAWMEGIRWSVRDSRKV